MSEKSSPRRQIADRFANFIITNDLANPFGGNVYSQESPREPKRRYYAVDLAVPGTDGTVSIYSPRFILVTMKGPKAIVSDRLFDNERNAKDFLRLLLVEHRPEEALAVTTKAQKVA